MRLESAQKHFSPSFPETAIVPEATEPVISYCNTRHFERPLSQKGCNPSRKEALI